MVLNTALFYLFVDDSNPKEQLNGYYSFKNAKDRSEGCIAFTSRLVRFLKNNRGITKPGSRRSRVIKRMETDEIYNYLRVQRTSDRVRELISSNGGGFRILKKSDIIQTWIVEFWNAGFNILEYLHIFLTYPQEIFTETDIEEAILNAENRLNIPGKLQLEWKEIRKFIH